MTHLPRGALCIALAASVGTSCDTPAESCQHAYYEHDYYKRDACIDGCDENADAFSCVKAAVAMVQGTLGPKDLDGALRYSRRACELDPKECSSVPFYECVADPGLCEKRCDQGAASACSWQARAMAVGNYRAPIDWTKSRAFYLKACELDRATCQEGLAAACPNPNSCLDACEGGMAASCYWMSILFTIGTETILRDPDKSKTWLERACQLDPTLSARCAGEALPAEQEPDAAD